MRHPIRSLRAVVSLIVCGGFVALGAFSASAKDWPTWRGPNRDAISSETNLLAEWPEDGPPLLAQFEGIGSGYSSVAVVGDRIYTMGKGGGGGNRRRGGSSLLCIDAKDGREIWSTPVGSGDPNCTPTVDGDLVYGLGYDGELLCANAKTGEEVWRVSFKNDFAGRVPGWGYSESPTVDGDRLIVSPGSKEALLVALDKKTGKVIWKTPSPDGRAGAGYASVVVSHAAGVKQYVNLLGRGIVSVDVDGKFLWAYDRIANGTANIPTPIVKDDFIFCSTGYGTGAALLQVVKRDAKLEIEEVYFLNAKDMQNHHGGMILVGDHVYCGHGHNAGLPLCIEMATGKAAWKPGRGAGSGSAAIVAADGHLYFRYENGVMALVEATPEEYRLKGSFKLASVKGKSWPHPVIAGGRLYLRDQSTLMVYDVARN